MKVIFLDIDGVLNKSMVMSERTPSGVKGIEDDLVQNLAELVSETNAKIVLISTWKDFWDRKEEYCDLDGRYLVKKLREFKIEVFDKTNEPHRKDRGYGISKFLEKNNVENFVIIDDTKYLDYKEFNLIKNFVQTDKKNGLDKTKVKECINILRAN